MPYYPYYFAGVRESINKETAENGAPARTRTADLMITNQLLYQLSYAGTFFFIIKLCIYQVILKLNF